MSRKLSKEEYDAFLNAISMKGFTLRRLSDQSRLFRASFHFVNFYALSMMLLYLFTSQFLMDHINPRLVQDGYITLFSTRLSIFFWLLGSFNIAFYFGISFRILVSIIFLYTLNITVEQIFMIYGSFRISEVPILAAYTLSRPLVMLALILILRTHRDN